MQKAKIVFVIQIAGLLAAFLYFYFSGRSIDLYFYTLVGSSLIYLLLGLQLKHIEVRKNEILLLILLMVAIKILFITINPIGSDDYYRYLWDGKVILNGINPFQYAPDAEELKHLHSEILPGLVSYPNLETIYFPLSQVSFAIAYLISGESVLGLKILLLLADIIITLGLYFLLTKRKSDLKYILLYTLSPLIIYQFFIDAHIDLIGIMFFLLAIYFYGKNKNIAALMLGASLALKPLFLLAIPIFFLSEESLRAKLKWLTIPILFLAITFIPFAITANPLSTLINFSRHWTFNGAVYNVLSLFLTSNYLMRFIVFVIFLIVYLLILRSKKNFIPTIYYSLFALYLFSPIVHPWYITWLIISLALYPKLSGMVYLSSITLSFYTVVIYQTTGIWEDNYLILLLEYIPVVLILFYEWFNSVKIHLSKTQRANAIFKKQN